MTRLISHTTSCYLYRFTQGLYNSMLTFVMMLLPM